MRDETEDLRMGLAEKLNAEAADRAVLEARYGQVWDTAEVQRDFEVLGFAAPFVLVRRRADSEKGSLLFQHWPRFYWGFEPSGRA